MRRTKIRVLFNVCIYYKDVGKYIFLYIPSLVNKNNISDYNYTVHTHTSRTHRKQCPGKEKGEERLIRRDKLIKIPLVGFYMEVGYRSTVFDIDNCRINLNIYTVGMKSLDIGTIIYIKIPAV